MSTPATTPAPSFSTHWYTRVIHYFQNIEVFVSATFVKLFGSAAAHNFAVGAEALLKSDLGRIAVAAVEEANNLATGVDKMNVALGKVLTAATSAGLDVKESLARLLIELAVSRMKSYFGAPPA